MQVVAIARLATSIEMEAGALAADLGTTAWDERLKLSAGLPAVLLATPDELRARALFHKLRARGHGALNLAATGVVPAEKMISLRRFRLADDALLAGEERLPWKDISSLLRATLRTRSESVAVVKEKKFDLTRTLATGGLVRNRTTQKEVTTRADEITPALYIFRRSGQTPFLLTEGGTHYEGLGPLLAPTAMRNFLVTIEELRARAPAAAFDDRLLTRKGSPQDMDLLAHLLAAAIDAGMT